MARKTAAAVVNDWFGFQRTGAPSATASATASARSGASSEDRTYEQKAKMYRELVEAQADLEARGEQRVLDEWKARYTAEQKEATDEAKLEVDTWKTLSGNLTRLTVAEIQAAAAMARSLAGRRGGESGGAGEAFWQTLIKKERRGAEPNTSTTDYVQPEDVKGRIISTLKDKNALGVKDAEAAKRAYVTQRALDSGAWTEAELRKEIGPELWQVYLDHKDTPQGDGARIAGIADRIEARKVTKPDLEAIARASLDSSKIDPESVDKGTRTKSDLEKELDVQRKSLEASLLGGPGEAAAAQATGWGGAPGGRFNGLTDAEMGALTGRPGFQRWAKEHGFSELGMMRGDTFVPGRDTMKAMHAAAAQTRREVTRLSGDFEGRVGAPPPQMFVLGGKSGKGNEVVEAVWAPQPDGSVDYIDLASGTSFTARDAAGNWKSPHHQDLYKKHLAAGAPGPIGLKGQKPWSVGDLRAHGSIDLLNEEISSDMGSFKIPEGSAVRGKRRMATFGEDPDVQASVVQEDGSLVRLRRPDTKSPWQVESGTLYAPPGEVSKKALDASTKDPTEAEIAAFAFPESKTKDPTEAEIAAFAFPESKTEEPTEAEIAAFAFRQDAPQKEEAARKAAALKAARDRATVQQAGILPATRIPKYFVEGGVVPQATAIGAQTLSPPPPTKASVGGLAGGLADRGGAFGRGLGAAPVPTPISLRSKEVPSSGEPLWKDTGTITFDDEIPAGAPSWKESVSRPEDTYVSPEAAAWEEASRRADALRRARLSATTEAPVSGG